jgi:hypothetical protein
VNELASLHHTARRETRRFGRGRMLDREDWAQEWAVSWLQAEGRWSQDWRHILGSTVRRCLPHTRPGYRSPDLTSIRELPDRMPGSSPSPDHSITTRDLVCAVLRQARYVHPCARRILVRLSHDESKRSIAQKYGYVDSRICQILNAIRSSHAHRNA